MTKLLANRWFRWTLLAIALNGLGVGIYRFTPPEPMWEQVGDNVSLLGVLAEDRGVLVSSFDTKTSRRSHDAALGEILLSPGPLRILDRTNGLEITRFLNENTEIHQFRLSPKRQFLVAEKVHAKDMAIESLLLLDLVNGITREVPVNFACIDGKLTFSPNDAYFGYVSENLKSLRVYESDTGQLVGIRPSIGEVNFSNEYFVHSIAKGRVEVCDLRHGKQVLLMENVDRYQFHFLDGGRFLAGPTMDEQNDSRRWVLRNLRTGQIETEISLRAEDDVHVAPGGRHIVVRKDDEKPFVEIRELPSGRILNSIVGEVFTMRFTPDGKHVGLVFNDEDIALRMVELSTQKVLWEKAAEQGFLPFEFGGPSSSMFTWQPEPGAMHAFEVQTGKRLRQLDLPQSRELNHPQFHATGDRRNVCMLQFHQAIPADKTRILTRLMNILPLLENASKHKNDIVLVMDGDTCRQRFRLDGGDVKMAVLSDDGDTLITQHAAVLRCWDTNAWKPLHWALGVPAGFAAMIVLHSVWRARRRAMPTRVSDSAA